MNPILFAAQSASVGPFANPALGSLLAGAAVAWLAFETTRAATADRRDDLLPSEGERARRRALRRHNAIYRLFEPWVDACAEIDARLFSRRLERVQRCLDLTAGACRWRAAEFLAASQLEAILIGCATAALGLLLFGVVCAIGLGLAMFGVFSELRLRGVADLATRRRAQVRSRLPYILDLMALMMEAGALFPTCLETAVAENAGHASGEEFGLVHAGMRQGIARAVALRELAARLDDADVAEVVFAINTAEDLGTPLDKILRSLAERMRGRRIQELERAAEEAKVHITWPAMLIMLACLLIVAAPSVLSGLFNG